MGIRSRLIALAVAVTVTMTVPFVGLATAQTLKITPVADSYANAGATTTTHGTSSSLASGSGAVSYLRFTVPTTPADQVLAGATLGLRTTTLASAGSPGVQTVREGSDAWTETGLTWSNRPSVGTAVLGTFSVPTANTAKSVPLDTAAVAPLAGRTVTLTVTSTSTDTLWFWSRQNTSTPPTLSLSYEARTTATPAPTVPPPSPTPAPSRSAGVPLIRSLAFGDSIVEGCCGTTAGNTVSDTWSAALGWAPPIIKGSGGTGYQTAGSVANRVPYTERIGPVLDANPELDVLIIEGGGNDPSNDLVAFRAAVRTTFSIAREKQPQARIYVLGPYSPNGAGYAEKRAVIVGEAAAMGFPYIEQIEWMKGWPDRLWTDGFHPNAAGHAMLGRRVAGELAMAGAPVAR